jgi:hypothetical protein
MVLWFDKVFLLRIGGISNHSQYMLPYAVNGKV